MHSMVMMLTSKENFAHSIIKLYVTNNKSLKSDTVGSSRPLGLVFIEVFPNKNYGSLLTKNKVFYLFRHTDLQKKLLFLSTDSLNAYDII